MAHQYHVSKNHLSFRNQNNTYNITRFLTMDTHPTLPWILLTIPYHGSSIPNVEKPPLISQSKYFVNMYIFLILFYYIFELETLSIPVWKRCCDVVILCYINILAQSNYIKIKLLIKTF